MHGLFADTQGAGDRDPGASLSPGPAHLLGLGAREVGVQSLQPAQLGQRLAALPVDPRMGRMLLAAEREGCLAEMLVVVAGLSIPDPRERPAEQREKAEALHRRLAELLAPTTLEVIDESAAHLGHAGSDGTGAGTHFRVRIGSPMFQGKTRLARHRLVYDALQDFVDTGLHALAIETL